MAIRITRNPAPLHLISWSFNICSNTPVTQDSDFAAICKISQFAAGSLWDPIERRGSAADRSEVSKFAAETGCHRVAVYTPVTQDGDLAAICKISQIAADRHWVVVWSHRAPWQRCRSQWGLQGRRGRRQVLNMLKTSAVRSPRKQVAVESQLTRRRIAAGALGAPWLLSDVAQGARNIAVGSLSGYT